MIREIDGYSMHALGAGCFFNGGSHQLKISDPATGHLRRERIFTSDREIEVHDVGIVEFGERAAYEIAHTVGWISPEVHKGVVDAATQLERERDELAAELGDLRAGVTGQLRLGSEAVVQVEQLREELEEVQAKLRSEQGARGGLQAKVNSLTKKLDTVSSFGD
jgi:hypothetical protein